MDTFDLSTRGLERLKNTIRVKYTKETKEKAIKAVNEICDIGLEGNYEGTQKKVFVYPDKVIGSIFNKLTIDRSTLTREKMDVGDFFFTLLYILGYRMEDLEEDMLKRKTAKFEFGKVVPTLFTIARVKRMIASSNAPEMTKEDMLELAKKMKALFPKGFMMDGIPWTEGPLLIVQRLEGFIRRFGNYPAEDIEKATERYVSAKKGSPYMKSLKNFIYNS